MRPDEVFVGKVKARRGHGAGNHVFREAEEMLVVRVALGAVGDDERGLPGTPGASTALRIVGRGGRNIAHAHGIQLGNVHAQLHGWGAVQDGKLGIAE